MKKLILLFVSALVLVSCSGDDDGPRTDFEAAKVIEIENPEFFEAGKTYEIDVTYFLSDACRSAAGINAQRGSSSNGEEEWRDIYITGIASYDSNLSVCNKDAGANGLNRKASFKITIGEDEDEPYTFYLWRGLDEDEKDIFTEVVVPVGEPGETLPEQAP